MPSRRLHPDVLLKLKIGAVMSRNKFTRDPAPVIAELHETAAGRADLLAFEVGMFLGDMEHRPEGDACTTLTDALRALGLDTAEGERTVHENLSGGQYTTRGFNGPHGPGL